MNKDIDVLGLGRVAVDLYAEQIQAELTDAQSFRKYVGGSAGNVVIGSARLGLKTAMLSKVGTDAMGQFVLETLNHEGVKTEYMQTTPDHLTGLVLLGVQPPDHFPLIFYRQNCADMQISEDLEVEAFARSKVLLLTGTGFSTEKMRRVSKEAIKLAKANGCQVALDLDYRPVLWDLANRGDGETRYIASSDVSRHYQTFLADCDLLVGTEEEFLIASGCETIELALQTVRSLSPQALLVLKKGADGCEIHVAKQPVVTTQPFKVEVLNVLGAGDAFLSGFFAGWLRGKPLATCCTMANANGALVVTRHGCAPAMPYKNELDVLINEQPLNFTTMQPVLNRLHHKGTLKPLPLPQFFLAFDHRVQFETSITEASLEPSLIKQFKEKVFEGFLDVYRHQPNLQKHLGLLVDPVYGGEIIHRATKHGCLLGLPIEKADKTPVEWLEGENLYGQLLLRPKTWFVKVLWKLNRDDDPARMQQQLTQLKHLSEVCQQLERRLMLEVISDDLPFAIEGVKSVAVYPEWWKIKPPQAQSEWDQVTRLISQHDSEAQMIILGGGEPPAHFASLFARTMHPQTSGFAIGRTIFWSAWQQFLQNPQYLDKVPAEVSQRFTALIENWQQAHGKVPEGVAV